MQKRLLYQFLLLAAILSAGCTTQSPQQGYQWENLDKLLAQINPPTFPDRDFDIRDYGALPDGKTDCSAAIRQAIEACNAAGGGRVVVPAGNFLTGAVYLKSNVNLYLTKDAVLRFSKDKDKFLPVVLTRFEGVECYNYSPFIYAYEEENIAITGSGTLDGQGGPDNWWDWKGREEYGWKAGQPDGREDTKKLYQMPEDGVPVAERVFGKGAYLRTNFIQPYRCRNILLDSITVIRSPMWVIHPVLSENITIQNVTVNSHGPNNDGCNPESSKNVLIRNCYFDTGDDCIAIKSGRNADGRRIAVPSENIVVQGCVMKDGHGGVVIGSEMTGGCRNVFVEDCTMDSPNLDRALRIKTNSMRGGIVENIFMRNVTVGEVSDAVIRVNYNYGEGDVGKHLPTVRNIYVSNVTSRKSTYAIYLAGYERSPVENLNIENCRFDGVRKESMLNHYIDLNLRNVYVNGQLQN